MEFVAITDNAIIMMVITKVVNTPDGATKIVAMIMAAETPDLCTCRNCRLHNVAMMGCFGIGVRSLKAARWLNLDYTGIRNHY